METLFRTETSQKSLLIIFYYNNKVTRKVEDFQKLSNEEIYQSLHLIVLNTANLSNSFQWPNFLEGNHILSPDIWSKTFSHWLEMFWWVASYIFSIWYKLIYFSFPFWNPAIHRMGNAPNILCPRCKEQEESQPYFILHCKLYKITLRLYQLTVNLEYAFNTPFKVTLKTIKMGTSFQFHDDVQFNILLTLSSEILLLNWAKIEGLELPFKQ